ncbi:MAG: glycine cleavage system protein GcvH [Deltaproteobacteria bacterium]
MADETELQFSEDHLWVLEMGDTARIGLSDYAQEQLGEILSITLLEPGKTVERGDALGELESQKTVVELISPVSGTVRTVNEIVLEDPSLINVDPYGKGWLLEAEIDDPEELEALMGLDEYEVFIED